MARTIRHRCGAMIGCGRRSTSCRAARHCWTSFRELTRWSRISPLSRRRSMKKQTIGKIQSSCRQSLSNICGSCTRWSGSTHKSRPSSPAASLELPTRSPPVCKVPRWRVHPGINSSSTAVRSRQSRQTWAWNSEWQSSEPNR